MFLNNSVKLVTLKNRFLMTAKALHSLRMCLTEQVDWHLKHCGCGSCFSMKAWVSLVWPMRSRDITTCSLLDALKAVLHSPKVGFLTAKKAKKIKENDWGGESDVHERLCLGITTDYISVLCYLLFCAVEEYIDPISYNKKQQ